MTGLPSIAPVHTEASVTTSSSEVLAANANRKYVRLQSDTTTALFLKLGAEAVVDEGVKLTNTQFFEISAAKGNLFTGAIYAIHGGSGGQNLMITEGT